MAGVITRRDAYDTIPGMVLDETILLIFRYTRSSWLVALLCMTPAFAPAVECSEIQFQDTRSTICRVDLRTDHLQLFLNDESGKPFTSFRRVAQSLAAHDEQLAFAMNAGMYRVDAASAGSPARDDDLCLPRLSNGFSRAEVANDSGRAAYAEYPCSRRYRRG